MSEPLIDKTVRLAREKALAASVDGIARDPAIEERINQAVRSAIGNAAGDQLMLYLRSITTNRILPATASDGELRYLEGMRAVVAILDVRRQTNPKGS